VRTAKFDCKIMLLPDELQAIENWRFAKRMPSRTSAVREIIRRGLAAEGFKTVELIELRCGQGQPT